MLEFKFLLYKTWLGSFAWAGASKDKDNFKLIDHI